MKAVFRMALGVIALFLAALACTDATSTPLASTSAPGNGASSGAPQDAQHELFVPNVAAGEAGQPNMGDTSAGGLPASAVILEANPTSLRVGETLTVVVRPDNLGLPVYTLSVFEPGATQPRELGKITYDNQGSVTTPPGQVLNLATQQASLDQATFTLTAVAPGSVTILVSVSGEAHGGYPAPASWTAAENSVIITVQP